MVLHFHQLGLQLLCREAQVELSGMGGRDAARLLADDDTEGVALLAHAQRGTVAQAQLFGNVEVVAHGQYAARRAQPVVGDDEGAVVQGRVLEEDVLDEPLVDVGVDDVARGDDVVERHVALDDNERAHLGLRHRHAGHDHGHDAPAQAVAVGGIVVAMLRHEQAQHGAYVAVAAHVVEELADVVLEDDDNGNHAHRHQLVEDGAEQAHLEYLRDEHPHDDEDDDAHEGVERARLTHQPVDVEQEHTYQQNVDKVFQREVYHGYS